jgi:hypothetical protein
VKGEKYKLQNKLLGYGQLAMGKQSKVKSEKYKLTEI